MSREARYFTGVQVSESEADVRIAYLHQYFRTPAMAGGTRSFEFARRLVEEGHDIHVVTCESREAGGVVWRESIEAGITVHWAAVEYSNTMTYRERLSAFFRFALLAARRSLSVGPDLVFATSTPLTIAIPAVYAAKRRRVPMVFETRDLWPEVPIALGALKSPLVRAAAWKLESWAYKNASFVVALSPGMEESISTRHTKTRVITIPNGCDVDLFGARELQGNSLRTTLPWLAQRPLLLYAGTLGLVNNVEYIVRMAEKLWELNPDVRVAIVGSGARENAVRRLAQDVGVLDRNLFMIKEVTKAEIVAFFGACNLALSTVLDVNALNANSANKVFDAFAAGRAVAINHDGWLADLLRSTGAGLVLPANDPATAALVVCDFLLNTDRIGAAETAASQLAQTDFNRDSLFRKFHQVLLEATSEHVSSRRRIAVT